MLYDSSNCYNGGGVSLKLICITLFWNLVRSVTFTQGIYSDPLSTKHNMTEHMKVFIGFYSGTVKACVLLGYGAVSFDKCPAWWCHLQGSNFSVGIQTLQKTPPLSLKTMGTSTQ
jgi:hypothetical protein